MESPQGRPLLSGIRIAAAVAVTGWAVLITAYFFRSNASLLGVFGSLFGSYTFSSDNSQPIDVLQALVATALTFGFGALLLRAIGVRAPLPCFLALAYAIGFGVSGVAFTLLTMAHALHPLPVWGLWGLLFAGPAVIVARRRREEPAPESAPCVPIPSRLYERLFWIAALVLCALITVTTFWHAVFLPETYWDSLILYLGYGRMTFLQQRVSLQGRGPSRHRPRRQLPAFVLKLWAMASTLFSHWSDLHARLAAPLATLGALVLVYGTVLDLWKNHTWAAMAALLFRAIPNGIAYSMYASDYAFAILFMAAFLYGVAQYARRFSSPWLLVLTLLPGISMNLNYLMGILWVVWGVAVLGTWLLRGEGPRLSDRAIGFLRSRALWLSFATGMAIACPWYIRNYALTNNPVYSFFPQIFTSSIRINREVLDSAHLEWFRNGDGVGVPAEFIRDFRAGHETRDVQADDFRREATLADRLNASFFFWVGFETVRLRDKQDPVVGSWVDRVAHLLHLVTVESPESRNVSKDMGILRWNHGYKMMPLFPGYFFPVVLLAAAGLFLKRAERTGPSPDFVVRVVTLGAAFLLAGCLLAYQYLLADFYLYQVIGIIVPAAITASFLFHFLSQTRRVGTALGIIVYTLVLVQGIAPGLAFGLMGFKLSTARQLGGELYSQGNLAAFRNPGLPPSVFWRLQYGADPDMWDFVNEHLKGERLLTHENRHYVIDPSITLVHLDDWDMQQGYDLPTAQATLEFLRAHGIRHYLRIPNEGKHKVNQRLGMGRLEKEGLMTVVYTAGESVLFELKD
jgi:hypothetical protein